MEALFNNASTAKQAFTVFGPSQYDQGQLPLHVVELAAEPKRNREQIRTNVPRLPGVYGMVDGLGELIYVGMSTQLRDRLLTYFTKGPVEAKERRVAKRATRLVWEVGEHEFLVRLRELELIRRWRPRYNAHGRPERREIGYIYLASSEAPHFCLGARPPKSSRHQLGASAGDASDAGRRQAAQPVLQAS